MANDFAGKKEQTNSIWTRTKETTPNPLPCQPFPYLKKEIRIKEQKRTINQVHCNIINLGCENRQFIPWFGRGRRVSLISRWCERTFDLYFLPPSYVAKGGKNKVFISWDNLSVYLVHNMALEDNTIESKCHVKEHTLAEKKLDTVSNTHFKALQIL